MKMYSVWDSKAEAYMQPFFMPTRGLAIRGIQDCMRNPEHNFSKYPSDFTLMELADWDEHKGTITSLEGAYNCGTLTQLKGEDLN